MSSVFFLIDRVLGKYKVLEHIGHGGMSEVYKGEQRQLHRLVAIKVLHPFLADDEGFVARFQREARIVATLRHPNIVQVFDFDYSAELDLYYMVMEYIDGPTLKMRLGQESLSLAYIAAVGAAIADALDYAHERGMIHRDIKPANIMFLDDDQPVLTDFGIARMLTLSGLTASGAMVGTPAYMAPEIGRGKSGTALSDIYALGVVLYQAVTGSLPFSSESPMGIVMQHINEPPPLPSTLLPSLPPALEAVILKALEKDPAARFNRAGVMAGALRQAMGLEGPNGKLTPIPLYKTPTESLVPPVREDSPAPLSPEPPPPEKVQIYEEAETTHQTEPGISIDSGADAIDSTGTGEIKDTETAQKRNPSFKKWIWRSLFILVIGIVVWFGLEGGIPSAIRPYLPQNPTHTPEISISIPDPTASPIPSQTPSPTPAPDVIVTRFPTPTATASPEPCIPRGYVDMVKIAPAEIVGPGSSLVATIGLRNTGACAWQTGTHLRFISGLILEAPEKLALNALLPGDTMQVHMPLLAPQALGVYTSVWQVRQPDARSLVNTIRLEIIVQDIATATPVPLSVGEPPEITPIPLSLPMAVLTTWQNIPDSPNWQGTALLQASGGTGTYRYYLGTVRDENVINAGKLSFTARRCDVLALDIWVISGTELIHWQGEIAYPDPGLCQ